MDAGLSEPLFRQVIGTGFDTLPPAVQALHRRSGLWRYAGEVEVERGTGPLAWCLAAATRLPPAGSGPVQVELEAGDSGERWVRHIGGRAMPSRLWREHDLLCEQLGLVRFGFRLSAEDGAIVWRVAQVHALRLRLPASWFGSVTARESERDGRYCFDVRAALPWLGLLVHYRGWLDVG